MLKKTFFALFCISLQPLVAHANKSTESNSMGEVKTSIPEQKQQHNLSTLNTAKLSAPYRALHQKLLAQHHDKVSYILVKDTTEVALPPSIEGGLLPGQQEEGAAYTSAQEKTSSRKSSSSASFLAPIKGKDTTSNLSEFHPKFGLPVPPQIPNNGGF